MKWSQVQWVNDDPETARYACEHCGALWDEADRIWSVRNGQWVAEKPFAGVAGFSINAMYSPWTRLSDGVRDFLSVRKSPDQLRVWTNTYLGETWEDAGETVDDWRLAERRETLQPVPDDVLLLTAGIDVQDNRLEVSVIGWGRDDESWVLSHDVLYGDPSTPQLWGALDSRLAQTFVTEEGRSLHIRAACIDSGGHFTNAVYQYAKRNQGRGVFAIKGVGGEGKALVGRPSKNNIAKCPLFPIGVHSAKDTLFGRLKIDDEGSGYVHFCDTLPDEYFKQLTAEKLVTKFHKGFKKREFVKVRPRNEALDCFVYALAAYSIMGVNVNTLQRAPIEKPAQKSTHGPVRPRKGGWVNSWR